MLMEPWLPTEHDKNKTLPSFKQALMQQFELLTLEADESESGAWQ
jgi:hypothetical protein